MPIVKFRKSVASGSFSHVIFYVERRGGDLTLLKFSKGVAEELVDAGRRYVVADLGGNPGSAMDLEIEDGSGSETLRFSLRSAHSRVILGDFDAN